MAGGSPDGALAVDQVPDVRRQINDLKHKLAADTSVGDARERLENAARQLERCIISKEVSRMLTCEMEELLDAFALWLDVEQSSASDPPAWDVSLQQAAAQLLSAAVALVRKGAGGLSKHSASISTRCAVALARRYLLTSSALGEGVRGSAEIVSLGNTLRSILRAIAVGAVEDEGSSEEEKDVMAPIEVSRVFDCYAQSYDSAMGVLQYSVPSIVTSWLQHEEVAGCRSGSDSACLFETVVDVGCGTGIMGRIFRGFCRRLLGCDLSPGMAITAAQLGLYDRVHMADCCAFLADMAPRTVDVVVCADVVEYVGDLRELFHAASEVLQPGGHFIVSAERLETSAPLHGIDVMGVAAGWALLPTERYAHSEEYLKACAKDVSLSVGRFDGLPCLREEEGSPLAGWLMFASKAGR